MVQVQNAFKHSTQAVPVLCVRAHADSCAEIHTTNVSGALDVECLAHQHQNTTMQNVTAPTLQYIQQLAISCGSASQSSQDQADADASLTSLDALHDLYEWVGAVSCGISGKWAFAFVNSCMQKHSSMLMFTERASLLTICT